MEKKFKFRVLMVLALAVGLTAGAANAKLIAYEPFDYPVGNVSVVMIGRDSASDIGFRSNWEGYSTDIEPVIAAGDLIANAGGTGGHFELVSPIGENSGDFDRELARPRLYDDGSAYWVSFVFEKVSGRVNGAQGLDFGNAYLGKCTQRTFYSLYVEGMADEYGIETTVNVTVVKPALLVLKVETNGTTDGDDWYVWVNPAPGATPDTGTADASLAGGNAEDLHTPDDPYPFYGLEGIGFGYSSFAGALANEDDCKFDEIRVGTLYQDVAGQGKLATIVSPADEATDVDPNTDANQGGTELDWTAPSDPDGALTYDVWFGTWYDYDTYGDDDPNFDNPACNTKIATGIAGTSVDPGSDLAMGTQYYWRVDVHDAGDGGHDYEGGIWTFTTWPAEPIITTQPDAVVTVPAGGSATFTVASGGNPGGGHTYQWYKEPATVMAGKTSSSMTLTNVQAADEDYYFCRVTNASGSTDSDSGRLLTERLMAHWKFDGGLTCEVDARNDGTSPETITYGTGVNGQAVKIEDPNKFVMVNDANALGQLKDITVSMWVKPNELAQALFFVPQAGGKEHYGDTGGVNLTEAISPTDRFVGDVADGFGETVFPGGINIAHVGAAVPDCLTAGEWNHIVFVYDTTNQVARYHVNGNQMVAARYHDFQGTVRATGQAYEQAIDAAVLPNVLPLSMGARNVEAPGYIFDQGLIDDARVYNYPLSPLEIAQLYNAFAAVDTDCFRPVEGDLNGDCKLDLVDYTEWADSWLLEYDIVPDHITPVIPD